MFREYITGGYCSLDIMLRVILSLGRQILSRLRNFELSWDSRTHVVRLKIFFWKRRSNTGGNILQDTGDDPSSR